MTYESRGELEALYLRCSPREAKWFTRLILKNYEPLIFQSEAIYGLCDRALPSTLKILDDFMAAIEAVQQAKTRLLPNSSRGSVIGNRLLTAVKPQLGIKVGRQPWLKARSIKHCLDMGRGRMSVERKIDGEYCQIHVDLSNSQSPIQIFSKSGKDSTEDRKKVHRSVTFFAPYCSIDKSAVLSWTL
jgi:DNA ligase-4